MVSKTSVARIALKEAKFEGLADSIKGQMALILSNADASEVSKVLINFSKSYEGFIVCGGMLDGAFLTGERSQDAFRFAVTRSAFGKTY